MSKSAEQQARDLLDAMEIDGAQNFSSGELVELANLIAELKGARETIAHMSEAMSWISGHDRTGNDHMEDAMRLAGQMDAIRRGYRDYEAALERREHGAVAAARFINVVIDNLEPEDNQ